MELIAQQKWEIENLKATQATGVSPQQLVSAILQAMSSLYVCSKKTPTDNQSNCGNKFAGTPRPPKPSMGIDGSLDITLTCQYCNDTGQELDNCKWLLYKLTHKCTAMQGILTEVSPVMKVMGLPLPALDKTEIGPQVEVKLMQTQFKIMKWAVAKYPSIELKIMGKSVSSLLDSGSMVSLIWQDNFNRYFRLQDEQQVQWLMLTTCS